MEDLALALGAAGTPQRRRQVEVHLGVIDGDAARIHASSCRVARAGFAADRVVEKTERDGGITSDARIEIGQDVDVELVLLAVAGNRRVGRHAALRIHEPYAPLEGAA